MLIIEDNPANLELMRYLLAAAGYVITSAVDGEAGLASAREDHPDLIVCDIQLPKMSGIAVARNLRQDAACKDIRLIAVTAFAMLGDREKLLAAGFDGYVSKPLDPETFAAEIAAFLPLPQRSTVEARSPEDGAAREKTRVDGPTAVCVDNLQSNLAFTSSILEHMGYDVTTTNTVADALRILRQRTPDLIMSDVCMPRQGGFDLIAAVKAEPALSTVPFIFLTSTALEASDREKAMALGADRFIIRPIEPGELIAEIEACLASTSSRKPQ
jgi:two-component system cell cycle response regulator